MKKAKLTVALISSSSAEFRLTQEALGLGRPRRLQGRTVVSRERPPVRLLAIEAGPGKTLTASAAQLLIDRYRPDLLLDVGTAGSLHDGLAIGDVVAGSWACEYDLCPPRELAACARDLTAATILAGSGDRPSQVLQSFASSLPEPGPRIVVGGVASGERTVSDSNTRRWLRETLGAVACSWESSAVLRPAALGGVPALILRVISDNADESTSIDFDRHWRPALEGYLPILGRLVFEGWLGRMLERAD